MRVYVKHLHDEVGMRLKSYSLDTAFGERVSASQRGRASKVQNNYVQIFIGRTQLVWPTELQAMQRKDAPTVATAIANVLCEIVDIAVSAVGSQCLVSIHCLLSGDAVSTNGAASRRVLGYFRTRPGVTYRIMVWVCATHQANLVVLVAICCRLEQNATKSNELCATCVRLFKYLTVSYSEEFASSLRAYVTQHARKRGRILSTDLQSARDASLRLVELDGRDCLPDDLMHVFNTGFGDLLHAGPDNISIEAVRRLFYDVLYKRVILIEEHPVPTRFFTFAGCVWALCRMLLLCLPITIFSVNTVKPQQMYAKRLTAVRKYWAKPSTPTELRVTSICLRLSTLVMNMTAQKAKKPDGKPDEREPPTNHTAMRVVPSQTSIARGPRIAIGRHQPARPEPELHPKTIFPLAVRLGQGIILRRSCAFFAELLSKLDCDPFFRDDVGDGNTSAKTAEVVFALLTTLLHILIRFRRFLRFPTKIQGLCKAFNPLTYQDVK